MVIRRTLGERAFDVANAIFLTIVSILCIYPLLYCLFASFSDPSQLAKHLGPLFYPLGFSTKAYVSVLGNAMFLRGLLNTVFYVILGTAINLIMTSITAYVMSRKNFFWKKAIMVYIVITMFFGGGLIPFYLVVKGIGLINSPFSLILPAAMSVFNMLIMRTYFQGISESIEESAVLDGANDITILIKIILPISMPVVAVMIVYYGVERWNAWFYAMLFLSKRDWQPLQLLLRNILNQNDATKFLKEIDLAGAQDQARLIKYALIMITVTPIVFIYPFVQKHFIKGVMIGSLKE